MVVGVIALVGTALAPGAVGVLIALLSFASILLIATRRTERRNALGVLRSYIPGRE